MSVADLRTIVISDFRSVRGQVAIALNAPVVLLHGANGAGKSTVMSALELALTGAVTGIDPVDPAQLVHRGAGRAQIDLVTSERNIAFAIEGSELSGEPLLGPEDARLLAARRELAALAKRADALAKRPGAADFAALERAAAEARAAADAWRARHGAPLEALLDELRARLPGIPAAGGAADPAAVRAVAL